MGHTHTTESDRRQYTLPLTRLLSIRRAVRQHGLVELFDGLNLSPKARFVIKILFGSAKKQHDKSRGERIRLCLQDLGPVFVKFGQALSTRPDILPVDIATELTKLQDQVPPFADDIAREIVEDGLSSAGLDFDQVFASFEAKPMASASVAQVHACTLIDGTEVVAKVLRPNILPVIESDLAVLYKIAQLAHDHWEQGPRLRPLEVVEEYDKTIHGELDMRTEAANAAQMKHNFVGSDLIYVPTIYWDYISENVLVMERIYGTSIREIDTLRAKNIDMRKLAYDGVEIFFKQAFEENFFHADMHPGNIFVADDGQYRAIDFGIMGTLSDEDATYLAENFIAFFNRDYKGVAEAHLRAGWVPEHTRCEEFETAIRTVCEPIFAKKISEISFGKFLLQLFQTARKFQMPIQPQLVLLQKTLLNIEGLGRQLYPDLDLWETAKPFLERWMKNQVGPQALLKQFKHELPMWQKTLPELPRLLQESVESQRQLMLATTQNAEHLKALENLQQQQINANKRQSRRQQAYLLMMTAAAVFIAAERYDLALFSSTSYKTFAIALGGIGIISLLLNSFTKSKKN